MLHSHLLYYPFYSIMHVQANQLPYQECSTKKTTPQEYSDLFYFLIFNYYIYFLHPNQISFYLSMHALYIDQSARSHFGLLNYT